MCFGSGAQTVYKTYTPDEDKAGNSIVLSQFSFSLPFNANSNRGQNYVDGTSNNNWFVPDGLSAHGGIGIHFKKWIGISANTGIDWRISQKLVSAPVYAMLTINPHFNKETSLVLQGGIGQAFALGRGNLSGTYQKYRVGIHFDDIMLFADASSFGYPVKDITETGILSLGISLLNF